MMTSQQKKAYVINAADSQLIACRKCHGLLDNDSGHVCGPIIAGGQDRDAGDMEQSGSALMMVLILGCVACVGGAVGAWVFHMMGW
jgi:hypothetical protein